jgi:hypothetical protein
MISSKKMLTDVKTKESKIWPPARRLENGRMCVCGYCAPALPPPAYELGWRSESSIIAELCCNGKIHNWDGDIKKLMLQYNHSVLSDPSNFY